MAELADALDLGSSGETCAGSSPVACTIIRGYSAVGRTSWSVTHPPKMTAERMAFKIECCQINDIHYLNVAHSVLRLNGIQIIRAKIT